MTYVVDAFTNWGDEHAKRWAAKLPAAPRCPLSDGSDPLRHPTSHRGCLVRPGRVRAVLRPAANPTPRGLWPAQREHRGSRTCNRCPAATNFETSSEAVKIRYCPVSFDLVAAPIHRRLCFDLVEPFQGRRHLA
jgi:hypothetical protein